MRSRWRKLALPTLDDIEQLVFAALAWSEDTADRTDRFTGTRISRSATCSLILSDRADEFMTLLHGSFPRSHLRNTVAGVKRTGCVPRGVGASTFPDLILDVAVDALIVTHPHPVQH